MHRNLWTIFNNNFELLLDGEIKDNKVVDKKFSPGQNLWTSEIPRLGFEDENAQKDYNNFVSDVITLFAEPTINEILIDAKIGEESEYNRKGVHDSLIIRKIEDYDVEEIIE